MKEHRITVCVCVFRRDAEDKARLQRRAHVGWMMDAWMDGWMDAHMDGWMDGWKDGWMEGSVAWQTVEKVYGSISKREHGLCEMMLAEGLVGPAGPPAGGFSVPSPRTMSSTTGHQPGDW